MPHSVASDLGLHCLPMSQKGDANGMKRLRDLSRKKMAKSKVLQSAIT